MQKITSEILNDSKIHISLIIGRVRNHALPVANAIKQVGLGGRVSYPPQAKIAEVIFSILLNNL